MSDNLLARFLGPQPSPKGVQPVRQPSAEAAPAAQPAITPAPAEGEYLPWGREHVDTTDIEVRCRNGEWAQMREPFITGVEGVGDAILTLKATSGAITLEGRNLGELRRLIRHRKVDFIQEFDAGKWRMPTANMPVVERVTIHQTRVPQLVPKGQGPSR